MSDWKLKRFWAKADTEMVDGRFHILLDGRPVRTPAKAVLAVPTQALADAIAVEWNAQDGDIDPSAMPVTRSANAAIDKVASNRDAVIEMLAEYGDSDLLCYRAQSPEALVQRQSGLWDPLIDWVQDRFDARLAVAEGVMHVPQDPKTLASLRAPMLKMDDFALAAFHDLVSLTGSLVLALAIVEGRLDADTAWDLSRVDENWQVEQWGEDDEATAAESIKRASYLDAVRFYQMSFT